MTNVPTNAEPSAASEPPRRDAAIVFILITIFLDVLSVGIIIPVLPELVLEFTDQDTSRAGMFVGIIGASYSLMQFLFAPILGALSDRFGRRPVILASMFGLGVDFVVQGLAPNIWWLFGGRLFAGVMGASFSTSNAYIADVSTPETRAKNYGLSGVMFGLGFICGPALGGLLGDIHTRLPFFAAATLALLNWMYGFFILPESLPPERRSSFTLAKANPLGTVKRLRKYPLVAGLSLVFVVASLAQRGLENVWVLSMEYRFGWDAKTNGLALGLVGLMAAMVQGLLVARIISALGERRTLMFGLIVSSIAFCGYGLASQGWMIPCIIVFGAFGGVVSPALQSLVADVVDSSEQGKIQGALTSLVSLTNIIAPLFFTAGLFSYFTSSRAIIHLPGAPFLVGSCLLFTAAVIAAMVFQRQPASSRKHS